MRCEGRQVKRGDAAVAAGAGGAPRHARLPVVWPTLRSDNRLAAAQLYVQACCSTPPHENVCRLLGWASPNSADGSLAGLEEGAVVYMVQENAGDEINKIYSPIQAYKYLKQIVQGARPNRLAAKLAVHR